MLPSCPNKGHVEIVLPNPLMVLHGATAPIEKQDEGRMRIPK